MAITEAANAAGWSPVGSTFDRGREIARRRTALGIKTVSSFADEVGMDRKSVSRAERGTASENTYLRLESWLAVRETGELLRGEGAEISAAGEEELDTDTIRVNVVGPHADWKVSVEGPTGDGDELARIAAELAERLGAGKDAANQDHRPGA